MRSCGASWRYERANVRDMRRCMLVGDGRQGFDFLGFLCRKVESWKYGSW
jgi:hypothetical protein